MSLKGTIALLSVRHICFIKKKDFINVIHSFANWIAFFVVVMLPVKLVFFI